MYLFDYVNTYILQASIRHSDSCTKQGVLLNSRKYLFIKWGYHALSAKHKTTATTTAEYIIK